MKMNKIVIMMTAIAILALTVTPVLAGGTYEYETDLEYGRKRLPAGMVGVNNIAGGIEVIYNTINTDWLLVETHVEVAASMDDIPQAKGNPIPGQFTYSNTHDPMVQYFRYEIMVGGGTVYIAAHAILYNECTGKFVTAWADGPDAIEFPGKNWAICFTFDVALPPD
jgi:hypothetical protein